MVADGGTAPPISRWEELGSGRPVRLEEADLWTVELPFIEAVATATGQHRHRPLVLVRLMATSDRGLIEGWGECAALADTTYDPEDVHQAFGSLERTLLPGLGSLAAQAERLPGPADLSPLHASAPASHMAFAALEMAVADTYLRAEDRSLADLLDVEGQEVELGAVVGMTPSEDELVEQVISLVEEGYSRLKLKIGPGWDVAPVAAVYRAVSHGESRSDSTTAPRMPSVQLQADANGSYATSDATGDENRLAELDRFGLLCLEQPLGRDDLAGHARLAAGLRTPICLDESVRSPQDIARALDMGACSVVCLKPARLGGLGQALGVVESCRAGGIPLWMGGMFESGYARGVNTTLAALPGFSWPGDLSPARAYLAADLVPPPELTQRADTAALAARPPTGPGMGEPPNLDTVVRLATQHVQMALR